MIAALMATARPERPVWPHTPTWALPAAAGQTFSVRVSGGAALRPKKNLHPDRAGGYHDGREGLLDQYYCHAAATTGARVGSFGNGDRLRRGFSLRRSVCPGRVPWPVERRL